MKKIIPSGFPRAEFDYVNYRGEAGHRKVMVYEIFYGSTEYHLDPQWLLDGWEDAKKAHRIFAMACMKNVEIT